MPRPDENPQVRPVEVAGGLASGRKRQGKARGFAAWLASHPEMTLGLLALVGVLVRAQSGFQLDEERFVAYADNLVHGFYAPPETRFLWNGPGLPLLLWPFRAWGLPLLVFKCLNPLWLALAVYAFRRTLVAAGLAGAMRWAWAAGLYWLAFGASWLPLIMTESLALACASVLLYAWVVGLQDRAMPRNAKTARQGFRRLAIADMLGGAAFGYLALTRFFFGYVLLVIGVTGFFLLFLAWVRAQAWRLGRRRRESAPGKAAMTSSPAAALGAVWVRTAGVGLLVCSPYLLYTYRLTGHVFYWGNTGGSQLYTLTLPEPNLLGDVVPLNVVEEHPDISPTAHALLQDLARRGLELDEVERDFAFRRAAWALLRAHPHKVFQNWRANVNRLIFDYPFSRFPGSHMRQKTGNLSLLFALWFYALLPTLWLALSRRRAWRVDSVAALGFAVLSWFGLSCVSAYARFVYPLLPAIAFFIAQTWSLTQSGFVAKKPTSP